jgi:hypothetical protein
VKIASAVMDPEIADIHFCVNDNLADFSNQKGILLY